MPQFSKKEVKILLAIGIVALAFGLTMTAIGGHFLSKEVGVPEYLISLRNSGITLSALAILWTALAAFRNSQLR